MKRRGVRLKDWALPGAAVCALVLFLVPMVSVGFIGDEVNASQYYGGMGYLGLTLVDAIRTDIGRWLTVSGRFFPFGFIYGSLLVVLFPGSSLANKVFQLICVAGNALTLYLLVRHLAGRRSALLAVVALIATVQVRFWYDPIVGWAGLLPVTLESCLLASWLWLIAFERRKLVFAGAALVAELAGLLNYELAYGLAIATAFVAWRRAPDVRWRTVAVGSTLGLVALLTVVDLLLRHLATAVAGSPYAVSGSSAYPRAVLLEILAALPLTYALLRPEPAIQPPFSLLLTHPHRQALLAAPIAAVLAFVALRPFAVRDGAIPAAPSPRTHRAMLIDLAGFGALLWVVPAAIISLSKRWQVEIVPGLGYLNVYIEYFGVAVIIAAFAPVWVQWATVRWRSAVAPVASATAVFSFVVFATAEANRSAYDAWRPIYTNGRINVDRALRGGLVDRVPPGQTIFYDDSYPFGPYSHFLVYQDTGRRYKTGVPSEVTTGAWCAGGHWPRSGYCDAKDGMWQYRSTSYDVDLAWVQLEHIVGLRKTGAAVRGYADDVEVWTTPARAPLAHAIGLRPVRSGANGTLYRYDDCLGLEASPSLADVIAPHVAFTSGFYDVEGPIEHRFLWSRPRATLLLTATHGVPAAARLRGSIVALGPARLDVAGAGLHRALEVDEHGRQIDLPIVLGASGSAELTLTTHATRTSAPPDLRELAVRFDGLRLEPVRCTTATGQARATSAHHS